MPSEMHRSVPVYLSVAARSDTGRVREKNEDAFVVADLTGGALLGQEAIRRFDVGERGVLLAVSDGMGGERAGEVASALVVETLTRAMATAPPDAPRDELMEAAIQKANDVVRRTASDPTHAGMGATLTAIYVRGREAFIATVGDSRAYLLRAGVIHQLTHDQSMAQLLMDQGVIGPQEAEFSPWRNVILQAMGRQSAVKVALAKLELRARDCFLLCSDGLTRTASDDKIREVIFSSPRLDAACDALVALANDRGGEDNVTVIAAGVGGALPPGTKDERVSRTFEILDSFDTTSVNVRGLETKIRV
jgi:PPM family protein phosphatase